MIDNLEQLEQRVYRSFWDDGLLDVFAGVGVLVIGLCWLRDLPVGAAIAPALLAPLWLPIRQRLIEPRLGHVEFTHARDRRNRRNMRATVWLGVAALIVALELYFLRDSLPAAMDPVWVAGLPAMLLGVMAVITAVLIGSARFLGYAVVLIVAGVGGVLVAWEPGRMLVTAGGVILVIAVGWLLRFLRAHPVPEDDA